MFDNKKESSRAGQADLEKQLEAEKSKLMAMPTQEVMVEMLLELKRIESRLDQVDTKLSVLNKLSFFGK